MVEILAQCATRLQPGLCVVRASSAPAPFTTPLHAPSPQAGQVGRTGQVGPRDGTDQFQRSTQQQQQQQQRRQRRRRRRRRARKRSTLRSDTVTCRIPPEPDATRAAREHWSSRSVWSRVSAPAGQPPGRRCRLTQSCPPGGPESPPECSRWTCGELVSVLLWLCMLVPRRCAGWRYLKVGLRMLQLRLWRVECSDIDLLSIVAWLSFVFIV